jgi:hypothetical protein
MANILYLMQHIKYNFKVMVLIASLLIIKIYQHLFSNIYIKDILMNVAQDLKLLMQFQYQTN